MNNALELEGSVEKILFHNEENGYAVFVLVLQANQSAVVRGHVSSLHPGEQLVVTGAWVNHPKFGKQFEASQCTIRTPTSVLGLKRYLSSGLIKGIGPIYAERLVNAFGEKVLEIIDKQPELLARVPGIGRARAQTITTAWQEQKDISHVMVFLQEKGITPTYAVKIYKTYGQESIALITENPYRLADDIWGVGFKIADQIAQKMGVPLHSLQRIKAGILFAISQETASGNLYAELTALKTQVITILELEAEYESLLKNALHALYEEHKIALISHEENHYITLTKHYTTEKNVASRIKKLLAQPSTITFDIDSIYQKMRIAEEQEIVLNEEQQKGILTCLQNKISIITGGPGTGKTTLIKKLLNILDDHRLIYKLAAPTGRAAKRITEGTRRHATTIHRLLEYDVLTRGFTKHEGDALKLDFLIIDEASMIDIFLAHALLRAMPYTGHLVFIGDNDQLPSVGAGNVLTDLITSGIIPCIRLKEIFRQASDSLIIVNAHRVNQGEFPVTSLPDAKKDFIFIKEQDPALVFDHLRSLYQTTLPRHGIRSHDAIVLVPMNRGIVGTQKINHDLQELLNPDNTNKQLSFQLYKYKVGDRVMQIRNNYDKAVFNGDIGVIEDINVSDRIVSVCFYDRTIEYESSDMDELVLAYAISIHKSQGSEYQAVIIPLFMQHFTLLQRNLIYTAITRAKKLCILIGQPRALTIALKNTKGSTRITFLNQYLTSELQCR